MGGLLAALFLFFAQFFVAGFVLIIVFIIVASVKMANARKEEQLKQEAAKKEKQAQDARNRERLEQMILQADRSDSLPAKKLLAQEAQRLGYSQQAIVNLRKELYERLRIENG